MDNIEENMFHTVEEAKVGEDSTKKAVVNAKSARKVKKINKIVFLLTKFLYQKLHRVLLLEFGDSQLVFL